VQAVAFSSDGDTVASGSLDGSIKLWSVSTGALCQTLRTREDLLCALAFSPEARWLAVSTKDQTIQLWNLDTGYIEQILMVDVRILELEFSDDGRQLKTDKGTLDICSEDEIFASAPTKTGVFVEREWISIKGEKVMWLSPEYRPTSSAVQVRGNLLAIGSSSGNVMVFGFDV
jgi:hypothetical protein